MGKRKTPHGKDDDEYWLSEVSKPAILSLCFWLTSAICTLEPDFFNFYGKG
jgi:hypothetical protein